MRVLALGIVALLALMCGCATGASDGGFGHAAGGGAGPGAAPGGAAQADAGTMRFDSGPSTQTTTDSGSLQDAAPAVDAGTSVDAAVVADTAPVLDTAMVADATALDTSVLDAMSALDSTATDSGGGTGLDPLLDLPDPAGTPCSTPGSEAQCPSIEVCRIDSASGGRCEGCTSCNNLGKACTQSSDCDILFQCYAGVCANICPLGTQYCGAVTNCLDVGNATYGVCSPP